MPAAVAIPLITAGIGASAELYGASKGAKAAKSAAKQETDASQKALDVSNQVYRQQQQNLAPYQQMGAASLGNLQSLAAQPVATQNPGGFGYTARAPQAMSLGSMGSIPMASQAGSTVLLRAPTGEVRPVPANQADNYIAQGATRVS